MAILEFINGANKTYSGMNKAISYILQHAKTKPHLTGGKDCSPKTAFNEFVITKQNFRKEKGRQFVHFTQSFSPEDKTTPEIINEAGKKLLEHEIFKNFQVVHATHIDRKHLHNHFIINTVSQVNGKKWQLSAKELEMLKQYSDEICKEFNLIIVDGEKGNYKKRGEYRAGSKGQSWKYELFLAVRECKWSSRSKEEFIDNMERLGYKVDWTEERKYITFTTPEGKKCRNRKLYPPEQFTKEALIEAFEINSQAADEKELKNRMDLILTMIQMLSGEDKNHKQGKYPLSMLEGQARKERAIEEAKGRGLDWSRGSGNEM
ncbi:relaxase/mobilization nuclease domain-containing protein [Clostridium cellulovorans]|uniref:Relaxase/mobilization nuclease family protein n=1 Tax=Clostridium cellulovorans (strain ATCC 35296 / DSM 3052 / OCM 3 / 743B) TaxID=573061 RepID=D9SPS6_CLOC7|nr:relaxase/mobilization nuclease domain-containing protein [Clostridium cellulovorans]ADL52062.1 Relaxase/mobilization nuclease family protein [Clostridium cellulovorans 743B]